MTVDNNETMSIIMTIMGFYSSAHVHSVFFEAL